MAEVGLDVGVSFGAKGVHITQWDSEDFLVEELRGREGLGLGRDRNLLTGSEMGEEGFDL